MMLFLLHSPAQKNKVSRTCTEPSETVSQNMFSPFNFLSQVFCYSNTKLANTLTTPGQVHLKLSLSVSVHVICSNTDLLCGSRVPFAASTPTSLRANFGLLFFCLIVRNLADFHMCLTEIDLLFFGSIMHSVLLPPILL